MFETDDSPGLLALALRYFLQLFVFCPVVMLGSVPFSALLSFLGLTGKHPSHIQFAGYEALTCFFLGVSVGWIIGRKVPSFLSIGRWIWVLPAIIGFPDMVREGLRSQPIPWLSEYVFDTGGEGGIAVYLFTLPTVSALGYSIGMALVGTKPKWAKLTDPSPMPAALTIIVAWGVLFGILALLAHRFEDSSIEAWSRVRTVVDRPGLWMSPDAVRLCSDRTSESGVLVPTLVMVEGLERRFCSQSRLLDPEAPRPADSWSIERVKILSGSNVGVEGWVLGYGLMKTMTP